MDFANWKISLIKTWNGCRVHIPDLTPLLNKHNHNIQLNCIWKPTLSAASSSCTSLTHNSVPIQREKKSIFRWNYRRSVSLEGPAPLACSQHMAPLLCSAGHLCETIPAYSAAPSEILIWGLLSWMASQKISNKGQEKKFKLEGETSPILH